MRSMSNFYLETTEQFLDSHMESWESSSVFNKLKQILSPIAMKIRLIILDAISYGIVIFLLLNLFLYVFAIICALFYIQSDIQFAKNLIIKPPLSVINLFLDAFKFYGFDLRLLIGKICYLTPHNNTINTTDYDNDEERNFELQDY